MNNNKLVVIFAVAIVVLAGVGITYMVTRDNSEAAITLASYPQTADVTFTWELPGMTAPARYDGVITAKRGEILTITATTPSNSTFLCWDDISTGTDPDRHTRTYIVSGNAELTAYCLTDSNTITDARGREVTMPGTIDSVFAMKSCSLQLVSFFDAVKKVKYTDGTTAGSGGENFSDPNRTHTYIMNNLKTLKSIDTNKYEAVILANPDIIISSEVDVSKLNTYQETVGIPVFAINADVEFDSPMMYYQLFALGKLFGEEKRALELVEGIRALISDITDKVLHIEGKTGYVCGMNFYGMGSVPFLRTSGDYLPFKYSKLDNVSSTNLAGVGGQPYDTNQERVIKNNPKIIFVDGIGLNGVEAYINDNKGTLQHIDAITNKSVYKTMIYKNWGTNWVNLMINVYYVASVVHPGEFDWTFEDKADEIIQLFYPGTKVTYSDLANAQTGGGCGLVFEAPR